MTHACSVSSRRIARHQIGSRIAYMQMSRRDTAAQYPFPGGFGPLSRRLYGDRVKAGFALQRGSSVKTGFERFSILAKGCGSAADHSDGAMIAHEIAEAIVASRSFARRRHLPRQAKIRSAPRRRGRTKKPLAACERLMIWMVHSTSVPAPPSACPA